MSNPVMSKNPYFRNTGVRPNQYSQPTPNQYGTQYQTDYAQQYGAPSYQQRYGDSFAAQEAAFQAQAAQAGAFAPANTGVETMSYRDAMNKTGILLGITVLAGVLTVMLLGMNPSAMLSLAMISTLAAFIVGMVIAFKPMVPSGLAIAYAALEGVALGGLTGVFDLIYPGVAMEAILGTTVVVGVTLALHYSGKVRTTAKGMKYVMIVALAGIIFGIVNIFITAFTDNNLYFSNPTLGILLGAVMIFIAAYMLINDFETVQYAVANGAPREFAWTTGIGIVMTILWIYVEVLRIAAIFASDN